jgi:PAS domain-containing protein
MQYLDENDFRRLASFPEQNPNPVIELKTNGEITYCNPAADRYFPDLKSLKLEHPVLANIRDAVEENQIDKLSGYKAHIKVEQLIFEQKFFFMPEHGIIRLYSSDITHQKKTEERLHQLSLFPIQNPNPVMEADMTLRQLTFKNPAAEALIRDIGTEDLTAPVYAEVEKRLDERKDFSCEIKIAGRYYEQKIFFIKDTSLVRIYLHDLTERKKNEKNLARLASFPEQNPNPIAELDLEGNITYTNKACNDLYPDIRELKFNHPLLSPFKNNFAHIIGGRITDSVEEISAMERYYIQRARLMPEMSLIRIFNTDITAQKEVEKMVREKNREITDSIMYAKRIQASLITSERYIERVLGELKNRK